MVLSSTTESVANTAGGTALVQATAALAADKVMAERQHRCDDVGDDQRRQRHPECRRHLSDGALDAKTNLTLGSLGFITAVGSYRRRRNDHRRGRNQTLQSIGGNETLVGAAASATRSLARRPGLPAT